ncbi:hypothetical protein WN48_00215 [Eufriesea mexicana]|uniref:Uncharacterized protein n=1 Tax=Eufriesea mexicana TaxID=516756 RepID=A0A310SH86_9HYME|nr:hypothetical protein WN48_00215 [Eufriesea mexicana]
MNADQQSVREIILESIAFCLLPLPSRRLFSTLLHHSPLISKFFESIHFPTRDYTVTSPTPHYVRRSMIEQQTREISNRPELKDGTPVS